MWAVGFQAFKHFLCIMCGLLVSRLLKLSVCYMWAVGFLAFKDFLCVICGLLVSRLLNTFCVLYVGCWFPGF